MNLRRIFVAACLAVVMPMWSASPPAGATDDGFGRDWRQLTDTVGLSWNQVAQVCPRDGVTPCSGTVGGRALTGWVWATGPQVVEFMGRYAPDILTANPPSVSGPEYLFQAMSFLDVMRPTFFFSGYPDTIGSTGGWTASTDATGAPVVGVAGYQFPFYNGSFAVGPVPDPDGVSAYRGVWLWRTAGLDYSPPVITPQIAGTAGRDGWFVSNVSLAWNVVDAESPVGATAGCDPTAVLTDTTGASFTCQATSAGGTSSASATVKRDVTRPTVACVKPVPVWTLGQTGGTVTATVADATSGPLVSPVSTVVNTSAVGSFTAPVTGADRAGNITSRSCSYRVVVPPCHGLVATIVGTGGPDVINGTDGPDVIVALGGNDTVKGNGGNDVICGGDGADQLEGGAGADFIDGGPGNDSIRGDAGKDTCTSGELRMSSCEILV